MGTATSQLDALVARLRAAGCVYAEDEARLLLAADTADIESLVARRIAGEPLEQVLGWAEFCGHRIRVERGVFVPRRRTELLARQAIAAATAPNSVFVELCCGTGAVALTVALARPGLRPHAADVDPIAVHCARTNLERVGGRVHRGDLFDALPAALRGHVDVLVANAPYIPSGELGLLPPEARLHEPRVALDGGPDGLNLHRQIAADAPSWLSADGIVVVETSERQGPAAAGIMRGAGLEAQIARDESLDATVVSGRPRG